MENNSTNLPYLYRQKRSTCAALSRAQEQEKLRRMSVEGRIKAALTMSSRFAWIKPAKKDG
jgi:hypothetical protein